ncbi:MAG: hypothetical protein ACK559_29465, partial [bacterium]
MARGSGADYPARPTAPGSRHAHARPRLRVRPRRVRRPRERLRPRLPELLPEALRRERVRHPRA